MANIIVYGIPNCDATKTAIKWLNKKEIAFSFHDYKQERISKQKLKEWCGKAGLETIFNKRSTTWRELTKAEQDKVTNQSSAIRLMIKNTSIIKRPVIEFGNNLLIGFDEAAFSKHFLN